MFKPRLGQSNMAASFKTKVMRFDIPLPDFDECCVSYCCIGITRSIGDTYESPRSQGDATKARIEVRLSGKKRFPT